jgi:hypothetical protein
MRTVKMKENLTYSLLSGIMPRVSFRLLQQKNYLPSENFITVFIDKQTQTPKLDAQVFASLKQVQN